MNGFAQMAQGAEGARMFTVQPADSSGSPLVAICRPETDIRDCVNQRNTIALAHGMPDPPRSRLNAQPENPKFHIGP